MQQTKAAAKREDIFPSIGVSIGSGRSNRTVARRGRIDRRQPGATDSCNSIASATCSLTLLEPLLGVRRSKGCIRIPASLNTFIDHYGLMDADYQRAVSQGQHLWILRATRTPTPWSGRYVVVVDSLRASRPAWAPLPSGSR